MSPLSMSQALRNRGHKLTLARHAVLQVLGSASDHLRVTEVHRRARRIVPRIGLASVYRTMELLARLKLVRPVHMEHRHRHYARIDKVHGHHLVCDGCGLVVEFSDCRVGGLARSLAKRTRFLIDDHSIELYGRCPKCRGSSRTAHSTLARRPGGHSTA